VVFTSRQTDEVAAGPSKDSKDEVLGSSFNGLPSSVIFSGFVGSQVLKITYNSITKFAS
jgi:hypothetical protein